MFDLPVTLATSSGNTSLLQQLKECEKAIENMLSAIEAGIITPSTKKRLEELEARREELNISILQEKLGKPKFTKEQIVGWIERFKYGDPNDLEYQKQIIDVFVNSIYVFEDKLVMTYNYKDESETISLEDVQLVFSSDIAGSAPPRTSGIAEFILVIPGVFYFFERMPAMRNTHITLSNEATTQSSGGKQ